MSRLVEGSRINAQLLIDKVTDYVVNRQNEDGGYNFCQGTESGAQDTYYGLAILNSLNTSLPDARKTVRFLNELNLDSIYSDYYIVKGLLLCGEKIDDNLKQRIAARLSSKLYFGSVEVFSEVSSEFITTFMALELADLLQINVRAQEVADWLLNFRNGDGGFGTQGQSNINSTYYAIASLNLLKQNLKEMRGTVAFVRSCEKPYGGFTVIPMNLAPYMEHTYYGVTTLDLLDEQAQYPSQTIDFILKCQNKNGGFARSELGISTFENTFQAVSVLRKLGFLSL